MAREKIDKTSVTPPYRQLAAILREQIESGELLPGEKLPAISALQTKYSRKDESLASLTVRKAIKMLKDEDLVETVSGWGTFVRENKPRRR
jgi:DNA-binding GntR family transcriptional regulator